ncbi:hypothetical protein MWE_1608 [Helicobacter pylori XZ274]|nr:hypothetical protein MWE_1608 [Helicobacter pylori XZ274]
MGQTNIVRSMLCLRHITNALIRSLYFEFAFLGLKVIASVKR